MDPLTPISSGEVIRIKVSSPVPYSESGLGQRVDRVGPTGTAIARMNPVSTVVFPVEISLDDAFGQNMLRTLESTARDRIRKEESDFGARQCGLPRGNDTGVKVVASTSVMMVARQATSMTDTYVLPNVRLTDRGWDPPKLGFRIFGKSGETLFEKIFERFSGSEDRGKAVILPRVDFEGLLLPWTLARLDRGCVLIAMRAAFNIFVEVEPNTLKEAARAAITFSR